jgi:hypothetical protein
MYRIPVESIEESGFSPSKELHPVTLLDGVGGDLFKLDEKKLSFPSQTGLRW